MSIQSEKESLKKVYKIVKYIMFFKNMNEMRTKKMPKNHIILKVKQKKSKFANET